MPVVSPMSGCPTFETEKKTEEKTERAEFKTPPYPTNRQSKTKLQWVEIIKDKNTETLVSYWTSFIMKILYNVSSRINNSSSTNKQFKIILEKRFYRHLLPKNKIRD